ncbi:MAG: hypothetical protein L3V56_04320 [Candidatus Magnetoovum sp. WYHC-5]|nr:hypothetical protein [Candidatus Magnetoovum sp. WYHC-5]
MEKLDAIDIKLLLNLIGCENYSTDKWNDLKPKSDATKVNVNDICKKLSNLNLLDIKEPITKLWLTATGKEELKNKESQLSKDSIIVLKECSKSKSKSDPKKITPNRKAIKELVGDIISLMKDLVQQGFIEVETGISISISEHGKQFLLYEFLPTDGKTPIISLKMFKNYIQFIRKGQLLLQPTVTEQVVGPTLSDEEALNLIKELDAELGTENYLPIFHLREKIGNRLQRDALDNILYKLVNEDKIKLSTLQEVSQYTKEQKNAGIPQPIGGPFFYIIVK